jgi:hypothetical protein
MKLEKSVQAPIRSVYPYVLWSFTWRAALILGFLLGNRPAPAGRERPHEAQAWTCPPPDAAPYEPPVDAGTPLPARASDGACPSCHAR